MWGNSQLKRLEPIDLLGVLQRALADENRGLGKHNSSNNRKSATNDC